MGVPKIKTTQVLLGAKLISDPYPYFRTDCGLWVNLLNTASEKGIRLYAMLVRLRAIGTKLVKDEKFGYRLEPIIRDKENRWGFPSMAAWDEEKKALYPYAKQLKEMLAEVKDDYQ